MKIERRSDPFNIRSHVFDYDTTGNWLKQVTHDFGPYASQTRDSATWREITYRP